MAGIDAAAFGERFAALAKALPGAEVGEVLAAAETVRVSDGDVLVTDGEDSDALFLVWEGDLDVAISTPAGAQTVATVGRGGIVGEVGLLDPGPATATISARGDGTVLRLDHDGLERLLASSPAAAADLLATLNHTVAERVEASMDRLDAAVDGGDAGALIDVEHLLYARETA